MTDLKITTINSITNAEKFRLIELVSQRPVLWNHTHPNFKKNENDEKFQAWFEVGKEMNIDQTKVEKYFKSLRESYRRELTNEKLTLNYESKWEFFDAMEFLRPMIKLRTSNPGKFAPLTPKSDEFTYYVQPSGLMVPRASNKRPSLTIEKVSPVKLVKDKVSPTSSTVSAPSPSKTTSFSVNNSPQSKNQKRKAEDQQTLISLPPMLSILGNMIPNGNGCYPSPAKKPRNEDGSYNSPNQTLEEQVSLSANERVVYHRSFGTFVSAKLNTLDDNLANQLMSEIFLTLLKY